MERAFILGFSIKRPFDLLLRLWSVVKPKPFFLGVFYTVNGVLDLIKLRVCDYVCCKVLGTISYFPWVFLISIMLAVCTHKKTLENWRP